jgi:glycosyltransferase involved in cell wall biosynthesis
LNHPILIIAYYWPPAGGPGVQRWLKFVTYLLEAGRQVHIIIPENAHYPVTDSSLESEIPDGLSVIKVPILEPSRWSSKLSRKRTQSLQKGIISKKASKLEQVLLWLRGNLFIPDARVGWKKKVVKAASHFLKGNPQTTLITTGPPHSVHLSGLELAKRHSSIKWIADFRDPWTTIGYHKDLKLTKNAAQKHLNLEYQVLNCADKIIVTSNFTKSEFQQKTDQEVVVITNGFDSEIPVDLSQPAGDFTISHVGTLLSDRDPKLLWKVLAQLVDENPAFKKSFKLQLAGNVSDDVVASITAAGLSSHLELLGYVDHEQALQLMRTAQSLLLIEIDSADTRAIIPGKLFEYLASCRPITAIGPPQADVQQMITDHHAGSYFEYDQEAALKEHLINLFQRFAQGQNSGNTDHSFLKYHRKETTQHLISEIDALWE